MELTRRDATIALAAISTGAITIGSRQFNDSSSSIPDLTDDELAAINRTFVAVAEVIYPSTVTGITAFVTTYLSGRLSQPDRAENTIDTVSELNELATQWHNNRVPELPRETREQLLHETGAAAADEDPTGTTAERIRFYIINELLLALYTSPTGGKLVGIENPIGHPGGLESYQIPTMNQD